MQRLVRTLIQQKGLTSFPSVTPDATIFEALSKLEYTQSSALIIINDGRIAGIFSEKDFAQASIRGFVNLGDPISTLMTTTIFYVTPLFTLEECLQVMTQTHVRHLPVLDNHKPIAMLSMRHIMEALVDHQQDQINQLLSYIGSPTVMPEPQQTMVIPMIKTTSLREAL